MMKIQYIAIFASSLATLFSQSAYADGGAQTDAGGCRTMNAPIFDLSGHYVPDGRVTSCPKSTVDATIGAGAIRSDQVLSISRGRYLQRQSFLLRGSPNRPYLFPAIHPSDVAASYVADPAFYPISQLGMGLPFQPNEIVSLGDLGDGHDWYGYTDLRMLPSRIRDAAPLTRSSVVIAVDGFSFRTPNALLGLLANADGLGQAKRYVEVVYLQPEDPSPRLHRVLLPLFARGQIEPEWSTMAAANRAFTSASASRPMGGSAMAGKVMAAIEAFKASPAGQDWQRNHKAYLQEMLVGAYRDGLMSGPSPDTTVHNCHTDPGGRCN